MAETTDEPSRTGGSGNFFFLNWNICSGRDGGLEKALRLLNAIGVKIVLLADTNLKRGIYNRCSSGYTVLATNAESAWKGGVALCWQEDDAYKVEEAGKMGTKRHHLRSCVGR